MKHYTNPVPNNKQGSRRRPTAFWWGTDSGKAWHQIANPPTKYSVPGETPSYLLPHPLSYIILALHCNIEHFTICITLTHTQPSLDLKLESIAVAALYHQPADFRVIFLYFAENRTSSPKHGTDVF